MIQVAVKEINSKQAQCRKVASYAIACLILAAFPILTLVFFKTVEQFFLIVTSFATLIVLIHLLMLTFLTRKLQKIGLEGLKEAIRSINIQFGLFIGVYAPFVVIDLLRVIFAENIKSLESKLDNITFNVLDIAAKSLVIQIPLIYMMQVHR